MPHYEISHTTPLTSSQRTHLAKEITSLHCTTFSTPSLFVNITFHFYNNDNKGIKEGFEQTSFVGGKEVQPNRITAHFRPRGPGARPQLEAISKALMKLWNETLEPERPGWMSDAKALHAIFVLEDVSLAVEQGVILPIAGEEKGWMEENRGEFERRAEEGDEAIEALLEEYVGG